MNEHDWDVFRRLLPLQDRYWRLLDEGDDKSLRLAANIHAEVRLSLAKYDVRRLGWDKPIEAPVAPVDADDDATAFMTTSIEKWRKRNLGEGA